MATKKPKKAKSQLLIMKSRQIFIAVALVAISFSLISCTNDGITINNRSKLDTLSFSSSMKGWELYSWANGNDWYYSFLPGTNRQKTYNEVIKNPIVVIGKDSLKMILNKLSANENIFWMGENWLKNIWLNNYDKLSLPDNNTVEEIKQYCIRKKLILLISN
ncbi:MAG: hypothetical protein Q7U47_08950 [Paludibacter sp.]|nr:hypothetical protein [Paludibacter sp.]